MTKILKYDAKGNLLPADSTKHAILLVNDLRIDVRKRKAVPHAQAMAQCAKVNLLGATWRSATVREAWALADLTNPNGPFDKNLFPHFPEYGWLWTSDPYAREADSAAPVFAWGVGLPNGFAYVGSRHYEGLALPVSPLAAPASQS